MPDKKLTDSEIIKALECCSNRYDCYSCEYYNQYCKGDMNVTLKDALDLINRLQADVENYKQIAEHQQSVTLDRGFEIKRLKEKIESLQAENERLKNAYKQCAWERDTFFEELKTAKAEAYKEFAEELNKKAMFPHEINDDYAVGLETINNLLKELVGEDKECGKNE